MIAIENKWLSEGIWWIVTGVVTIFILYPIIYYKLDYPFFKTNTLFIFCFFIFIRWILFWHLTPYARYQWLKLALIFLMIPASFLLSYEFSDFKNYLDEIGLQQMVENLSESDQLSMAKYIRTEMIFFSICCLINSFLVPLKLIWNIWKQHNLNTV